MVFSKFESFAARPPTPPKDLKEVNDSDIDEALRFLEDPFGTNNHIAATTTVARSLLNTPVQSPSSELGGNLASSGSQKKRVNFEIPPCPAPAPASTASPHPWTPLHSSPLRPLPQTRISRPLKSILKPSDPNSTPPPGSHEGTAAHKFHSFAEMLESVVKMLAQGARSSKLDAYIQLYNTMSAYDKIPDTQSLIDKMPLFAQFIRRDMQAMGISGKGYDSQLIGQALKLLMAFVRLPELKPVMDDDFCSFLVDRIIQVASDAEMPKGVINAHLALLMQQSFRPKTMTVGRVERILDVLDGIHDRVTGFSVQAYRVRVYRKLIQQRPEVMAKHTERWFKYVVKGMLTNQKDIHQSALETAISAAKSIGSDRQVTKAVLAIMNRVKSDGNTFGSLFAQQLESNSNSDTAAQVPHIWGVLTAFLKDSLQENVFLPLQDWLRVFERLYSSDKDAVKVQTNVAFNFLVYAVNITQNTPIAWSKMFVNIAQHQFQNRGPGKRSDIDTATSAYFTLLYYALRPNVPHAQLDRFWADFVADFWRPLVHASPKNAIAACRVLSALFNGSKKPWNEQRALELKPQFLVQREELPHLESRWVRKSLCVILPFVETLLDATPWTPDIGEDEPAKTMWIALMNSLVEAGSQEVMASSETKDAIAHIINMLRRMWDRHTTKLALQQHKEKSWADKFCFLIETVIEKLGASQFTDKCLIRNGQDFEVASTPSHRSRQNAPRVSPLIYFVDLLVSRSEGRLSDPVRLRAVQVGLQPCFDAQNTRLARLELLRDCIAAVDPTNKSAVAIDFRRRIASLTTFCIQDHPSDSKEQQSRQLGKEYEVVVGIIASLDPPHGQDVLSAFIDAVRREAGEGALVLAVVERLSEYFLLKTPKENHAACVPLASILLNNLPRTISRRALEQAKTILFPSSRTANRSQEFDPYNHFYAAVISIGTTAYESLGDDASQSNGLNITYQNFLAALSSAIGSAPISLLAIFLRKTQIMLKLWIEDSGRIVRKSQQEALWQTICDSIRKLPRKDSSTLTALEPLILAGFTSRRRHIVNIAIKTWNDTFGKHQNLEYPSGLENALQSLRHLVDLDLPNLPARETDPESRLSFCDSESETAETPRATRSSPVKESPLRTRKSSKKSRSKSRSPAVSSVSSKKSSSRRTPKARLRHEDSQIQFEAIKSPPSALFRQESQVLTERQKEIMERQRTTGNLFSSIGAKPSSQSELIPAERTPQELLSDPMAAEFLDEETRTPSNAMASMGPMDVYLGSSPTPSTRTRSQQVRSDDTNIATPTAVRSIQGLDDLTNLGSSPPRLEKGLTTTEDLAIGLTNEVVGEGFECRRPEISFSDSFDDGTTIDEEALVAAEFEDQVDDVADSLDGLPTEDDYDTPSSTVEVQLNAQLEEELHARSQPNEKVSETEETQQDSNLYVEAFTHQQDLDHVKHRQTTINTPLKASKKLETDGQAPNKSGGNNTSENISTPSRKQTPEEPLSSQVRSLRRSTRHSMTPSPTRKSRRSHRESPISSSAKKGKKKETSGQPKPAESSKQVMDFANDPDCIVVASPAVEKSLKRKTRASSKSPEKSKVVVPETTRKPSVRRSISLLSQVENISDDILVEDTPAAKRPRNQNDKDASDARSTRATPPPQDPRVMTKRLSHIQVTPKHTPALRLRQPSPVIEDTVIEDDKQESTSQPESQSRQAAAAIATPSRSFTERVILTPRSILDRLKKMVSDCSNMVLGRAEEREFDDVLFDLRTQVHAAGRRTHEPDNSTSG
ncbi:Rap1-interacting factor 1 N terminal-domain-containing protein [Dendryphion nanum]|uniref:Rap1-interacting factor 1 N terminal-domain-containing protein n=1 Tax=Dendryphion nanum TaxID=256645 RepID=A0A9P9EE56_9PLEO|nr:Rap1-interacting factor 1 N terminal-domain-containing protein [Dendryphion nanum]